MGYLDRFRTKPVPKEIFGKTHKKYNNSLIERIKIVESKGIVYDEPFSIGDKVGQATVNPKDKNFDLYLDVYKSVPIAKCAIDHTSNFAIQSGYQIEGNETDKKKFEEFNKLYNFDLVLTNVMRQMQIFGNAWLEIDKTATGIKFLPAKSMRVVVSTKDSDNGTIKGYKQLVTNREAIEFDIDNIIHFKWNEIGNSFYGISDLRASLGIIQRILQFQEDIGEVIHRYGNPLLHHRMGTDEAPAPSDTDRDAYIGVLEDREPGEDLVTSRNVEIIPIAANLRIVQPDGMIKSLENQLIAGFKIPAFFIRGGESSNRATAMTELQAFDRNVNALRDAVARVVEDKIFPAIGITDAKIVWNALSIADEETKANIVNALSSMRTGAQVPLEVAFDIVGWGAYRDQIQNIINMGQGQDKDEEPEEVSSRSRKPPREQED